MIAAVDMAISDEVLRLRPEAHAICREEMVAKMKKFLNWRFLPRDQQRWFTERLGPEHGYATILTLCVEYECPNTTAPVSQPPAARSAEHDAV
jgi:hypothetical protein